MKTTSIIALEKAAREALKALLKEYGELGTPQIDKSSLYAYSFHFIKTPNDEIFLYPASIHTEVANWHGDGIYNLERNRNDQE